MFGRLIRYAEEEFARENSAIGFDTIYEKGKYELVGAFYSKIYTEADGEDAFRYYDYPDLSDPEDFEYYVREVKAAAVYDTGVEPEYGDTLLTLSTCEHYTTGGRFAVVFRKLLRASRVSEILHSTPPPFTEQSIRIELNVS